MRAAGRYTSVDDIVRPVHTFSCLLPTLSIKLNNSSANPAVVVRHRLVGAEGFCEFGHLRQDSA